MEDHSSMGEYATIGQCPHDVVRWRCHTNLVKRWVDHDGIAIPDPYEVLNIDGNLLVYGGASIQWQTLIGNGTSTAGQTLTYFNNANSYIGVGDSSTVEAATQTDLQGTTNRLRVAMDATYPLHTDGTALANASIIFRSTYASAQANWAWNEWGIFNNGTTGSGRMLNRKVQSLGTKTSAAAWTLTITLTLS